MYLTLLKCVSQLLEESVRLLPGLSLLWADPTCYLLTTGIDLNAWNREVKNPNHYQTNKLVFKLFTVVGCTISIINLSQWGVTWETQLWLCMWGSFRDRWTEGRKQTLNASGTSPGVKSGKGKTSGMPKNTPPSHSSSTELWARSLSVPQRGVCHDAHPSFPSLSSFLPSFSLSLPLPPSLSSCFPSSFPSLPLSLLSPSLSLPPFLPFRMDSIPEPQARTDPFPLSCFCQVFLLQQQKGPNTSTNVWTQ